MSPIHSCMKVFPFCVLDIVKCQLTSTTTLLKHIFVVMGVSASPHPLFIHSNFIPNTSILNTHAKSYAKNYITSEGIKKEDIDHVPSKISQTSKSKSSSINVQHIHLYNKFRSLDPHDVS